VIIADIKEIFSEVCLVQHLAFASTKNYRHGDCPFSENNKSIGCLKRNNYNNLSTSTTVSRLKHERANQMQYLPMTAFLLGVFGCVALFIYLGFMIEKEPVEICMSAGRGYFGDKELVIKCLEALPKK
jgi:hypothetical protein